VSACYSIYIICYKKSRLIRLHQPCRTVTCTHKSDQVPVEHGDRVDGDSGRLEPRRCRCRRRRSLHYVRMAVGDQNRDLIHSCPMSVTRRKLNEHNALIVTNFEVEITTGIAFLMGTRIPWESHGNKNKTPTREWERVEIN